MNSPVSPNNDKRPTWGSVILDQFMADDLSVVNSARVSFGKRSLTLSDADKGLINFLMRERHGTPFVIRGSFPIHEKNLKVSCQSL